MGRGAKRTDNDCSEGSRWIRRSRSDPKSGRVACSPNPNGKNQYKDFLRESRRPCPVVATLPLLAALLTVLLVCVIDEVGRTVKPIRTAHHGKATK